MPFPIQHGDGDMGDVADESIVRCRFKIERNDRVLLFIRARFSGGSGTADLTLYIDKHPVSQTPKTYFELYTFLDVGPTKQVHGRWTKDEQDAWQFKKGDELVIEWTNPDPGNMSWSLEVGLTNARD